MLKNFCFGLIVNLFLFTRILASTNTSVFESVVKVKSGHSFGSGACINLTDDKIFILSNRHVVGNSQDVKIRFYKAGHESVEIPGEVVWTAFRRNEPVDISLITVNRNKLSWTPAIINFDFNDKELNFGDTVTTIGCPGAKWPRAYQGHIDRVNNGCYYITPIVVPGQSGSVLFNKDGTKAIGLIAWYEGRYGKAMTIETIKRAVLGQHSNYYYNQPYNFPDVDYEAVEVGLFRRGGDGCGPDGCFRNRKPKNPDRDPKFRINPKLDDENNNEEDGGGDNIFPTMPEEDKPKDTEDTEDGADIVPPAPDVEYATVSDFNTVKGKVTDVENKVNGLGERLDALEIKVNGKQDINDTVTPGYIYKLEEKLAEKQDKGKFVIPGQLNEFKEAIQANLDKKQNVGNYVEENNFNNWSENFGDSLKKEILAVAKKDIAKGIEQVVDSKIQEKASVVKDTKETIIETIREVIPAGYTNSGIQGGLPALAILIIGWLWRRRGGATPPFPKVK